MTEIKKTLSILKARWLEAVLVVALAVSCRVPKLIFLQGKPAPAFEDRLLCLLAAFPIAVVTMLVAAGFLRSVCLERLSRRPLSALIQNGKHFLLRLIVVSLVLGIALVLLFQLLFYPLLGFFRWLSNNFDNPLAYFLYDTSYFWLTQLPTIIILVVFLKPLLLLPALIIVTDCSLFESCKLLKKCKLTRARDLLILFWLSVALSLYALHILNLVLPDSLTYFLYAKTVARPILILIGSATTNFLSLAVAVLAVRFVASLDLVYDGGQSSLNSGNLVEPSTEN